MKMRKLWILVTLMVVSVTVWAPLQAQGQDVFDLGKIVITATRIPNLLQNVPVSTTLITREDIEKSGARTISEVLEFTGGVLVRSYGTIGAAGSLSIRGSTDSEVLILMDGRPLNDPVRGGADLNAYSLDNVEAIEILRGPFSAVYGANAMGGVINIITRKPPSELTAKISASYGSFNTSIISVSPGGSLGKWGWLLTADNISSDGWRENSAYQGNHYTARLDGPLTDSIKVTLSANCATRHLGMPGSIYWAPSQATQDNDDGGITLALKAKPNQHSEISARLFTESRQLIADTHDPGWPTRDTTNASARGLELNYHWPVSPKHMLTLGGDIREDEVSLTAADGSSRLAGGKKSVSTRALYFEDQWQVAPYLTVLLGTRWDEFSREGSGIHTESKLCPMIATLLEFDERTRIRLNYGQGYHPPTVFDLYWYEDWGGGSGMFGNPDLIPEESTGYEIGLEREFNKLVLGRVSYFYSEAKNLIVWVNTVGWTWEAVNFTNASFSGIEAEVKLAPSPNFSCSLSYTNLDSRDRAEYSGNYLPYAPSQKSDLTLSWRADSGVQISLQGEYVGGMYTNRENTHKLDPYTIGRLRVSWKTGQESEAFLVLDNLFNQEYQMVEGYPLPGLTLRGGFNLVI